MGPRFRFVRAIFAVVLVSGALVWPASSPVSRVAASDPTAVRLVAQPFLSGFSAPQYVMHAGDGSGRLFVVEQAGRIQLVKNGVKQATPFLDISSLVTYAAGGERGLYTVAFHPQYTTNGFFYVNYARYSSDPNQLGDIVLARYHVSANADVADPTSAQIVLIVPHHTYANHNGGTVAFGPDGYLYFSIGDGGSGGDPNGNGQNTHVLLAKLLRLDINQNDPIRGTPYAIPPTNPFAGNAAAGEPEIWAYGLRNPWRYSFDPPSSQLFIGDVGQNLFEEVDVEPVTTAGLNYGWNVMEGNHCFNPADFNTPLSSCTITGLTLPVREYTHPDSSGNGAPDCAVVGGFVYRGTRYPPLVGLYLYADYCSGRIWALDQPTPVGAWRNTLLLQAPYFINSFGEDQSGELYFTTLGSGTGGNSIIHLANFTAMSLSVSSGPTTGGNTLTLTGTGFVAGVTVSFGGSAASVQSVADGQLVVSLPGHGTGTVDVTVSNGGYTTTLPNAYTFVSTAPPPHSTVPPIPHPNPVPDGHPVTGSSPGTPTPLPAPARH